jgi:hypothetical protein
LRRFLAIALQLGLIVAIVHLFRIEQERFFLEVIGLSAAGFLVHYWLPTSWRLPFFCLLSLFSIILFLGVMTAGYVLGIGFGLIALCQLRVRLLFLVLFTLLAGVLLFIWRVESEETFWVIVGSMFMFRLIVFLHEFGQVNERPPLLQTVAYFFCLPSVSFPLLPVLDFTTIRDTYYDDDAYAIYETGVVWIVRGLTHLLAYRFIKYFLLPAPHEIVDFPHFMLFLAANYALYLRVSGWFHIITGILHLFGFNLPRTHDNYFLASSVSDIWRRINIYWKDFMTKVFFFPAFYGLRRFGTRTALVGAGLFVFVATWLLHSYQIFWVRGSLPLGWRDAAMWLTAGVVVTIALLLEYRRRASAKPASESATLASASMGMAIHALKIAGTFVLVSLFWARWTLPNFASYVWVLADSGAFGVRDLLLVLGGIVIIMAIGAIVGLASATPWVQWWTANRQVIARFLTPATLLVLLAMGIPQIGDVLGSASNDVLATMRLETTEPVEALVTVQGYYEEIADVPMPSSPLVALPWRPKPPTPGIKYAEFSRSIDDLLERELIPGWTGTVAGKPFAVNDLGMRDRLDRTKAKPAGTCRIAAVGSSVVMGWGAGDEETFCRLLEDRLRSERPGKRVDVLNFGTGSSIALHRRVLLERKVFDFEPDALFYFAHQDELPGPGKHIAWLVGRGNDMPYPYLRDIVRQAGLTAAMPRAEAEARLAPFAPEILRGLYGDIAAECRKRNVVPIWIWLPIPGVTNVKVKMSEVAELAEEAGFVAIDLSKWDDGHEPYDVKFDLHHPNTLGHRLIAERLYAELKAQPKALPACAK